jgi:glutathione S-transferase
MIQLYYSPGTASLAPHFLLEELGLPYELILVDTEKKENQQAAYLKLNPKGKIPLLVDGIFQLTESAAICMHLVECYRENITTPFFVPVMASPERAHLYQWMLYLSNTLQSELLTYFYPDRLSTDAVIAAQIKSAAEQRIAPMLTYIDASLAASQGDYLLGELTVADIFLMVLCRWTRGMTTPARSYPELGIYLGRLFQRPAIQKALAMEGIVAPFF